MLEDHRERLGNFAERQDIQSRIEDVERERAAGREMSLHTRETRELGVDVEQMRKRAERSRHETKHAAELEGAHVAVDRLHVRTLGPQDAQHRRRRVEADARDPGARDRQQRPTRAAPELQHRAAALDGEIAVERDVTRRVTQPRIDRVVCLRDQLVVGVGVAHRKSESAANVRRSGTCGQP